MATIRTKSEFYRLWNLGVLGNRPRAWPNAAALAGSGYAGLVTMRSGSGKGGGVCRYRVPAAEALATASPTTTFNEAMPDDELLIQGEVGHMESGLCLTYSTVPGLAMREALRKAKTARGAGALAILGAYLSPSSRDDLDALWALYPDAVIEFGTYARNLGTLPHRNTVIWEVRDY